MMQIGKFYVPKPRPGSAVPQPALQAAG
jgi:hypothetical protein